MLSEVERARYLTFVFCFCSPQAQSPRVGAASEPQRVATAPSPAGHRPALRDRRFLESLLSLCACIGTMNLTTRWERGSVSRSASLQPQVLRVTDPRSGTAGSWRAFFRLFSACIGTMNRFVLVLVVLVLESKPPNRGRGRERRRGRKGGSWKARV